MVKEPKQGRDLAKQRASMRRMRAELKEQGFCSCRTMVIPSLSDRFRDLKKKHKMACFNTVLSAMIRKAMAQYSIEEIRIPPPTEGESTTRGLNVYIPVEQYEFLERITYYNRGVSLGIAIEAVAACVDDLSPAAVQLPLLEKDSL